MGQGEVISVGCLFEEGLSSRLQDRIILGAERKSAYIDEKSKLMTAYHEVRWRADDA